MHIIYLAGNSVHNRDWIKKVKETFDAFSTGTILHYTHWTSGESLIDIEAESHKLADLVKDMPEYFVFAKSAGSILALKTIHEKTFEPKKAFLCGHPYPFAKEINLPIDTYLESLTIPTIFMQNEFDPFFSYEALVQTLEKHPPHNYECIKNPDVDTHDYDTYEDLSTRVNKFFTTA